MNARATGPGVRVRRDLVRRDAQVQLEPREREVQPPAVALRDAREQARAAPRPGPPAAPRPRRRRAGSRGPGRGTSGPAPSPPRTPSGASAASSRAVSSSAARLLNATMHTDPGSAPPSTSQATRATRVVVLPEPAGATHSTGPGGAVAAARWSGASRARRSATDGWETAAHGPASVTRRRLPPACPVRSGAPRTARSVGGPKVPIGAESGSRSAVPDACGRGRSVRSVPLCWSAERAGQVRPRVPSSSEVPP